MINFLVETLGLSAKERPWNDLDSLPLYLRRGRKYSVLTINGLEFLLIHADLSKFSLPAYRKQLHQLHKYWPGEIILSFDTLSSYQRKALIHQGFSFIVPGSQLFLPALGILLQERMTPGKRKSLHCSPAAQYLLLFLCFQESGFSKPPKKIDLARRLGLSAMNITRAVKELAELKLVKVTRNGRCDYVTPVYFGKELYEMASPHLISPVQKRVFVRNTPVLKNCPYSGESALAARTMLNPPEIPVQAIERKEFNQLQNLEIIDPAWYDELDYIELEIWKYDPVLLASNGIVDIISLTASLQEQNDERIGLAIEELWEEYKR